MASPYRKRGKVFKVAVNKGSNSMHGHVKTEKVSWFIFFACYFAYVLVSMTKNTYSAAMSAIVQDGVFDKSSVGLINAAFYFVYGSTQMIGGYLVDKVSPFKLFAIGTLFSALCNTAMAISDTYEVMLVAWALNGLAQFSIWPALLKIAASVILPEHRKKALTYIAFAYPLGTVMSYLIAAGVLSFSSWSGLFWISVFAMIISTLLVMRSEYHAKCEIEPIQKSEREKESSVSEKKSDKSIWKLILKSGIIFMTIPSIIRCMLDVGIKSWGPTMIMESYGVSPSFATFITTILIVANLVAVFIVNWLYPKKCKNAPAATGLLFVATVPLLLLVVFTGKIHLAFIVLSLACVTTLMTASTQLMNVIIPAVFENEGKSGVITGFLNSFAAFGCMISNYIYGYMAERFGWTFTTITWVLICVVAIVFCFANAPLWKRYTTEK